VGPDLGSSLFATRTNLFKKNLTKNWHFEMGAEYFFKAVIMHPSIQWVNP